MGIRKILFLIETGGPGGAEKIIIDLAKHLKPKGYWPIVGLLKKGWFFNKLNSEGIETFIINLRGSYDLYCLVQIAKVVKEKKISLIHSHEFMMNVYGTLAGKLTGVPVISTVHGKNYFWQKWQRRLAYRYVAKASCLVAVSENLKKFILKKIRIANCRVRVIHNGINPQAYNRPERIAALYDELKIRPGMSVVGTVGNLYPVKGHKFFLEAASQVSKICPNSMFLIVGRGRLLGELKKQAKILSINNKVKFLGFRDDVPDLLSVFNVFVLPSIHESYSLATIEAMAASKPVVATKSGGPEEIVTDGVNGFLVPTANPDALAEKIITLIQDLALAQRLGTEARKRVEEEFSLEKMLRNYQVLYEEKITPPLKKQR